MGAAAMLTPELRCPTTATTPASTSRRATALPSSASALSSTATSSSVTLCPSTRTPDWFISSIASLTPFTMSLPSGASGPDSGCATPIRIVLPTLEQALDRTATATVSARITARKDMGLSFRMGPGWMRFRPSAGLWAPTGPGISHFLEALPDLGSAFEAVDGGVPMLAGSYRDALRALDFFHDGVV